MMHAVQATKTCCVQHVKLGDMCLGCAAGDRCPRGQLIVLRMQSCPLLPSPDDPAFLPAGHASALLLNNVLNL